MTEENETPKAAKPATEPVRPDVSSLFYEVREGQYSPLLHRRG